MKKVYVNEKWCIGCHLCEYYCYFASTNEKDMARTLKGKSIRPVIIVEESKGITFALSCRHCSEPLCVKGCITGALSKKNGTIVVNKSKCIGCYTCILSCPYGAIFPSEGSIIQKCELCTNNIHGTPQCVQNCPNRAIVFEDRGEAL